MDERELTALLKQEGEIVTERLDHWAAVAGDRDFVYYGEDDAALTFAEWMLSPLMPGPSNSKASACPRGL